jgi:hypothetical protein
MPPLLIFITLGLFAEGKNREVSRFMLGSQFGINVKKLFIRHGVFVSLMLKI